MMTTCECTLKMETSQREESSVTYVEATVGEAGGQTLYIRDLI